MMDKSQYPKDQWYDAYGEYDAYPLWENGAPGQEPALGQPEPSLEFFPAENGAGKGCVLVMAGGGYMNKTSYEGPDVAKRLNEGGINAAVLDYRVIPYDKELIVGDAQRAVRYLRCHAAKFGINAADIAALGFSAGGNLALMTGFCGDDGDAQSSDPVERCSSRVSAVISCYSAINFVEEYEEDEGYYYDYKLEQGTVYPPTFIWHSFRDRLVHCGSSLTLANRLQEIGTPVELHMFPYGEHGQGLANYQAGDEKRDNELAQVWSELCIRWLHFYGY